MTIEKQKNIRQIVKAIKNHLNLPDNHVIKELAPIIENLNGELKFKEDASLFASIEKSSPLSTSNFIITLRKTYPERDRYTIAHQLGHLILHMGYLRDKQKWEEISSKRMDRLHSDSEEELEANEFAGELLIPEGLLREHCSSLPKEEIAKFFQVRESAVELRAKALGLRPWFQ